MTNETDRRDRRRKLVPEMEGRTARWYARQRGSAPMMAEYRTRAADLAADLPEGAAVLEVAPGPGYQAVELARRGSLRVTGLDVSHTMVEIATEYARREGVSVDFRRGDATHLPFEAATFDLVLCQAAFKNFAHPVTALDEMHRVLRPGGSAVVEDLNHTATAADIEKEVRRMRLGRLNTFVTRFTLNALRRRAYTPGRFRDLAAASAFGDCEIRTTGIGLQVWLTRSAD